MNLTLTRAAARFMRMMLIADGVPGAGVRLSVAPGGCSGLSAEIDVAAAPAANEAAVTIDGITLFLSAQSRILLHEVTIDFVDTISSQGLVFHDPKQVACSTSGAG
ncbi:iron-sulfur cluster assembly accessory protein [soil metagenome]